MVLQGQQAMGLSDLQSPDGQTMNVNNYILPENSFAPNIGELKKYDLIYQISKYIKRSHLALCYSKMPTLWGYTAAYIQGT